MVFRNSRINSMYLSQQHNDLNRYIKNWIKSFFPEHYIKDEAFMFNWSTIQVDQKTVMGLHHQRSKVDLVTHKFLVNFGPNPLQFILNSILLLVFPTMDTKFTYFNRTHCLLFKTQPLLYGLRLEAFYQFQTVTVGLTNRFKRTQETLLVTWHCL